MKKQAKRWLSISVAFAMVFTMAFANVFVKSAQAATGTVYSVNTAPPSGATAINHNEPATSGATDNSPASEMTTVDSNSNPHSGGWSGYAQPSGQPYILSVNGWWSDGFCWMYTNAGNAGDTVSLTFIGDYVDVVGYQNNSGSIANVTIDGDSYGQIDSYSTGSATGTLFSADLPDGQHTLTITLVGPDPNAVDNGPYLAITGFDYSQTGEVTPPAAQVMINETSNPGDGQWSANPQPGGQPYTLSFNDNTGWWYSPGYWMYTNKDHTNDYADLTFTGTSVTVNFQGISASALVSIDGGAQVVADAPNTLSYTFDSLSDAQHTLRVMVNPADTSANGTVNIDSFAYTPSENETPDLTLTTVDVNSNPFNGRWTDYTQPGGQPYVLGFDGNSWWWSDDSCWMYDNYSDTGHPVSFTFVGDYVDVVGYEGSGGTVADISIDGVSYGQVDSYADTSKTGTLFSTDLPDGQHTLTVTLVGASPNATDDRPVFQISGFDYHQTGAVKAPSVKTTVDTNSNPHSGGWTGYEQPDGQPYVLSVNGWWSDGFCWMYTNAGNAGDTVSLTFVGDYVDVVGYRNTSGAIANVTIDGDSYGQIDSYSAANDTGTLFSADLPDGQHTLTVTLVGPDPNAVNNGPYLAITGFDYNQTGIVTSTGDQVMVDVNSNPINADLHGYWNVYSQPSGQPYTLSFTGGWFSDPGYWIYDNTSNSGDVMKFQFTGTSVTVNFLSISAMCFVSLDGNAAVTVDPSQSTAYTLSRLAAGPHTLAIMPDAGSTTGSNTLNINSFVYTPSEIATLPNVPSGQTVIDGASNPNTGSWAGYTDPNASHDYTISAGGGWTSGSVWMTDGAGDTGSATVGFNGDYVIVNGNMGPTSGKVSFAVDGVVQPVDTYNAASGTGMIFEAAGLTPGNHTLTITPAGANAAAVSPVSVNINSITYGATALNTVDNEAYPLSGNCDSSGVSYPYISFGNIGGGSSGWWDDGWGGWIYDDAGNINDYVNVTFSGDCVAATGITAPYIGMASYYIDGKLYQTVDGYNAADLGVQTLFTASGLTPGIHTLQIRVAGHNPDCAAGRVFVVLSSVLYGTGVPAWSSPSVAITSTPNQTFYYMGDTTPNYTGMTVYYYTAPSASGVCLAYPVNDYTVAGFDTSNTGSVALTVSYNGSSASFSVSVIASLVYTPIPSHVTVSDPAYYSTIGGTGSVTVTFDAPGFTGVTVQSLHKPDATDSNQYGYLKTIADLVSIGPDGHGTFQFDPADLPFGPITVIITGTGGTIPTDICYLQLYNTAGDTSWDGPNMSEAYKEQPNALTDNGFTSATMPLVSDQEFNTRPTFSRTGIGTDYATAKPDPSSWPEFGNSKFADDGYTYGPCVNYTPFTLMDNGAYGAKNFLKMENLYWGGAVVEPNWGQTMTGAFLSSMATNGTGYFRSEGGSPSYFEVRMYIPPNSGEWPGFWLLTPTNGNDASIATNICDEYDIPEIYSGGGLPTDQRGFTFTRHIWGDPTLGNWGLGGQDSTQNYGNKVNCVSGWHTFGCLITQSTTYLYFDGQPITAAGGSFPTLPQIWENGAYYMIQNITQTDQTKTATGYLRYGASAEMYVDYVRVYQSSQEDYSLLFNNFNLTANSDITLQVNRGPSAQGASGSYTVVVPGGWTVTSAGAVLTGPDTYTIPYAPAAQDLITVHVPAGYSEMTGQVTVTPVSGGTTYPTLVATTQTLGVYSTCIYPTIDPSGGYDVHFELTDNVAAPFSNVTVTMTQTIGGGVVGFTGTQVIDSVAGNGGTGECVFSGISLDEYNLYDCTFQIQLTPDYVASVVRPMSALLVVTSDNTTAYADGTTVKIDGTLNSDWDGAQQFTLTPSDASVTTSGFGEFKQDANYLYLAVQIKDRVQYNTSPNVADAWWYDSLQMSFGPTRPYGPTPDDPQLRVTAALGTAPGAGTGLQVEYCDTAVNSSLSGYGDLPGAICKISRDDDAQLTTYTIALPKSQILPANFNTAADNIGFACVVNNADDANGRAGWLSYMDGIAVGGKNPALFGDLLLTDATAAAAKSSDATLSDLTVSEGTLAPTFDPAVTDYTVSVPNSVSSIDIEATANDANAVVTGDTGTQSLNVGDNLYKVTVTAEDGSVQVYTVTVTRAAAPVLDLRFDLNGDGKVDAADLTFLMGYLNKKASSSAAAKKCDLDGDGTVTMADYQMLAAYINSLQ